MRTIKFRIFNKKIKSYIDIYSSAIMIDELNNLNDNLIVEWCTGLHDKNGKEIFEGDKLRDDYHDEDTVIEDYSVVVWDGKLCQWAIDNSFAQDGSSYTNLVEYFGRENLEIIGNVFENADLVKL